MDSIADATRLPARSTIRPSVRLPHCLTASLPHCLFALPSVCFAVCLLCRLFALLCRAVPWMWVYIACRWACWLGVSTPRARHSRRL
jgi:hypothetical protein